MAKPKVVYVHPGEMVEFRFVPEDLPKNSKEWNSLINPSKMLLLMGNSLCLAAADPIVRMVSWDYLSKVVGVWK